MLYESTPTASARTASSIISRTVSASLNRRPDDSALTSPNESSPNSIAWEVIASSSSPASEPGYTNHLRRGILAGRDYEARPPATGLPTTPERRQPGAWLRPQREPGRATHARAESPHARRARSSPSAAREGLVRGR